MFDFKKIKTEDIPSALERADRYLMMNEPLSAESICLDVLNVDPENQQALIKIILSLSHQFDHQIFPAFNRALEFLPQLEGDYYKAFYEGIIYERRAKAHLRKSGFGTGRVAYEWFQKAMDAYERAISMRPGGNPDSLLRWNTCARIMIEHEDVKPSTSDAFQHMLE